MSISQEVKRRRIERGLSRHQLAAMGGMSEVWLEHFENDMNAQVPPAIVVYQLAYALDTTVDDLKRIELKLASSRTVLMNAAMMPFDGTYERREIAQQEFVRRVQIAYENELLHSYIGYKATATHIGEISGVPVEMAREDTVITKYDNILVCKLRHRVKHKELLLVLHEYDFQYLNIVYKGRDNL